MKKNKHWFTFIELFITVSIIAVLWTIWFITYSKSIPDSRDAARISHLSEIGNSFNVYKLKNKLPLSDMFVEVKVDNVLVWYQASLSEDLLNNINYTWVEWWKDPKDNVYYTYYLSRDFNRFQLLGYLEVYTNLKTTSFLNQVKAIDYTDRFPYMVWDKLWIIVDSTTNIPVQELPNFQSQWFINFTWSLLWSYMLNIENWVYFTNSDNIIVWQKIKELLNVR